jgi:exodeoxyribonuclease VII large subunit
LKDLFDTPSPNTGTKTNNIPEYSVDEISQRLKNIVEDHFSYVRIRGEISGLKQYPSGHIYFNLKDDEAVINAVCFKNMAANLDFIPEEGAEVVITGNITIYKGRSNYQIIVKKIEAAGQGALMALLEKRKKQFEKEGLFNQAHKKQVTGLFPQKIAVITSEAGAVFHDICHRVGERFPCEILFYPTSVQGAGTALRIANAIKFFNEIDKTNEIPDVIIVARGGGSIEDLWEFNEEVLIRAVFDSRIPIVSAVGHETDTTLIDYVSDLRAPTPTAAAEIVTPDRNEILIKLDNIGCTISQNLYRKITDFKNRIALINSNISRNLQQVIFKFLEKLSRLSVKKPGEYFNAKKYEFEKLAKTFTENFKNILINKKHKLSLLEISPRLLENQFNLQKQKIENTAKLLNSLSYKNTLKRGYAIVSDKDNGLIKSAKEFPDLATIKFYDSEIEIKKT